MKNLQKRNNESNFGNPKIIFEDQYLAVIDKPAGVIVNRADTARGIETLQDWVEKKLKVESGKLKVEEDKDFVDRSGIVHRLDKETSGVILVAKDPESFKNLQTQFKEGRVEKTYIGLVHGKVLQETGEINAPVGRLPWDRQKFGILPMGRESKTLFKVLEYKILKNGKKEEILTLLEYYPKTGRTHQIRVHSRFINHPIFGDSLYAGRKNMKSDRKILPRHFLHAAKIKFTHPKTGERVEFDSPIPSELKELILSFE